jgi:hypothetical protein
VPRGANHVFCVEIFWCVFFCGPNYEQGNLELSSALHQAAADQATLGTPEYDRNQLVNVRI